MVGEDLGEVMAKYRSKKSAGGPWKPHKQGWEPKHKERHSVAAEDKWQFNWNCTCSGMGLCDWCAWIEREIELGYESLRETNNG